MDISCKEHGEAILGVRIQVKMCEFTLAINIQISRQTKYELVRKVARQQAASSETR